MQPNRIVVLDTTLRDGEQAPGFAMSAKDKLSVARALADLRVDVIEAGFPAASEEDYDGVRAIAADVGRSAAGPGESPRIAALARCVPRDIERAAEALAPAHRSRLHVFLATSDRHLRVKLGIERHEAIARISSEVARARALAEDVEFSAEDASRSDHEFLLEAVRAAIDAGARTINLPDTVGCATPEGVARMVRSVQSGVAGTHGVILSVHCHDDLGLATANSLAAIRAGARQVECTLGGIGERAGNAALEEVVMALRTHEAHYGATTGVRTTHLAAAAAAVALATGVAPPPNKAIVGSNAFAHGSGIHQHGMLRDRETYEALRAEDVGRCAAELVLGRHSGKHAVLARLRSLGHTVPADDVGPLLERFQRAAAARPRIDDTTLVGLMSPRPERATPLADGVQA